MPKLRPLRFATFRRLAAGYWVNEFGNWMGEIALAILVWDRTGSPLATAALFLALRLLPSLLAPLLTTRIEMLRPRFVLASLYLLEAVFFIWMALLTRHFSFAALLILCSLDGMLAITAKALTRGISATWLIRRDLLREGNAILNLGVMVSSALGPVLAGAVVAWKGASTALMIDAATFLATAAIVGTASGLVVESEREAQFRGRVRAGVDVLRSYVAVRRLLFAIAAVMLLGSIAVPIEVVFAKQTLHAGDRGYGLLLGAWGVGMIVGGSGFAMAAHVRLMRLLGAGTLLAVIGYAGLATSPTLAVACVFSAIGGTGNGAGWIAAVTAVQERIPVSTQSAVMAVLEGINQVMPATGFIAGGAVTALTSPRDAYAVSAAGMALVILAVALRPIDRIHLSQVESDHADIRARAATMHGDASRGAQEPAAPERTLTVTSG